MASLQQEDALGSVIFRLARNGKCRITHNGTNQIAWHAYDATASRVPLAGRGIELYAIVARAPGRSSRL